MHEYGHEFHEFYVLANAREFFSSRIYANLARISRIFEKIRGSFVYIREIMIRENSRDNHSCKFASSSIRENS